MSKWKFQRPPWSASEFCCALSATFHFYCFWKSASTWFHLGPVSSWLSKPRPKQICIVSFNWCPFCHTVSHRNTQCSNTDRLPFALLRYESPGHSSHTVHGKFIALSSTGYSHVSGIYKELRSYQSWKWSNAKSQQKRVKSLTLPRSQGISTFRNITI